MIKIPDKKEFISITGPEQYIKHWDAGSPVPQKEDPVTLIKRKRIIPEDKIFRCLTAFTDIDESKTHLWATGFYSKYLLKYDWSTNNVSWFDFGMPIEHMALNKNYIIVLSSDGTQTFKFDLSLEKKVDEYPIIS